MEDLPTQNWATHDPLFAEPCSNLNRCDRWLLSVATVICQYSTLLFDVNHCWTQLLCCVALNCIQMQWGFCSTVHYNA